MHLNGFDGKGINIAVIGKPILVARKLFSGKIIIEKVTTSCDDSLEGNVVIDDIYNILPNAKIHYYTESINHDSREVVMSRLDLLQKIISYNYSVSLEERIKVVALNTSLLYHNRHLYDDSEVKSILAALRNNLKEQNCFLFDPSEFYKYFLEQTPIFNESLSSIIDFKYIPKDQNRSTQNKVLVPGNRRLNIVNETDDVRRVYRGTTYYGWSTPIIAAIFAYAKVLSPEITYKRFFELAYETGDKYNKIPVINMYNLIKSL